MKKKTKARIIVWIVILALGCTAGAVLTGIQYKHSLTTVNQKAFIDLALESLDQAYDQLAQCNQYQTLFHIFLGSAIGAAVLLIVFFVICFVVDHLKQRNTVIMYGAVPNQMNQQANPNAYGMPNQTTVPTVPNQAMTQAPTNQQPGNFTAPTNQQPGNFVPQANQQTAIFVPPNSAPEQAVPQFAPQQAAPGYVPQQAVPDYVPGMDQVAAGMEPDRNK